MKLKEMNKDLVVFTTRQVVEDKKPIVYVSLDEDGDLQMFSNDNVFESDAMITSLGQMLLYDESLNKIPNIEAGQSYIRKTHHDSWHLFLGEK